MPTIKHLKPQKPMKYRIIGKNLNENSYPPINSVGNAEKMDDGTLLFTPDDQSHFPPDELPEDFSGYVVQESELMAVYPTKTYWKPPA